MNDKATTADAGQPAPATCSHVSAAHAEMEAKVKGGAEAVGLDWSRVKRGLERLLTIAEPIARLTPNPYDDAAVAFLRSLLNGPNPTS